MSNLLDINQDTKVSELCALCHECNARTFKIVEEDEDGRATGAVIVVDGQPETEAILAAIETVENGWR